MNNVLKTGLTGVFVASLVTLSACNGSDGSSTTAQQEPLNKFLFVGENSATGSELWSSDGTAEGTILVKDINDSGNSYPSSFTQIGSTTFFIADDGINGSELWKTDANGTSQVIDLNPDGSAYIRNLTEFNGELYFMLGSTTATSSAGLWKSDGTTAGTVFVSSTIPASRNYTIKSTAAYLYFKYINNSTVYRTDGTTAGTVSLPTASSTGEYYYNVNDFEVVNNTLYFVASTFNAAGSNIGNKLWMSADATSEVSLVSSTLNISGYNDQLAALNNTLMFNANDGVGGNILWMTDGTAQGTVPFQNASNQNQTIYSNREISSAGSKVYFYTNYYTLWATDGTPAGTEQISNSASSRLLGANNGVAYFKENTNRSLWFTDGTTAGTLKLADTSMSISVATTNDLYYTVYEDNNRLGLWKTSGTVASTVKITSLANPIGESGAIRNLYATDSSVFFNGYDSQSGYELWSSDDTAAGTVLLADINTTSNASSYPYGYIELNGKVYFIGFSDETGYSLWVSDGTATGTSVIKTGFYGIYELVVAGNNIYFNGDTIENGSELWVSDGTTEGTKIVIELYEGEASTGPYNFYAFNNQLYFNVEGLLLRTDGSIEGTEVVSLNEAYSMQHIGNKLFFVSYGNNSDRELWVTEGSLTSTHIVKDINPDNDGLYRNTPLIIIGNFIYFGADDGINGRELWKSDGTEAGTTMVIDLNGNNTGLDSNSSDTFAVANNELYFIGFDLNGNETLYKTDGTEAGTVALTDDTSSLRAWRISNMYSYNGSVYFNGNTSVFGNELWKTDGTADGTLMLKDIYTDHDDGEPYGFKEVNGSLFFFATDEVNGRELWKTDGTTEGTVLVKDVNTGAENGASGLNSEDNNYYDYCRRCD